MVTTRVASIQWFVKGFEAQPFSIGIDVHKRSYYVAIRRVDGEAMTCGFVLRIHKDSWSRSIGYLIGCPQWPTRLVLRGLVLPGCYVQQASRPSWQLPAGSLER